MAEESFRNIMISFLMLGLFIVLIVTIVFEMGINYDVSSDRLDPVTTGAFDKTEYEVELNKSDVESSQFRERFESGDVDDVDDPSGIFSVTGDIIGIVTTPYNILANIGSNILNIPVIVFHVLLAIINIVLLTGLWSLLRRGN